MSYVHLFCIFHNYILYVFVGHSNVYLTGLKAPTSQLTNSNICQAHYCCDQVAVIPLPSRDTADAEVTV